jgi:ABC-type histidine transport system ATPase subunit
MGTFRWTPERMEQLEYAVQYRKRVALERRGNEYVVVAAGLQQSRGRDALVGYLAMTGEEMLFVLGDLDRFQVLDS